VCTVPTPREQLAIALKKARLEAGFESHGALAKRLNVSRPVVSKAENPLHPVPSDALLAAWAGMTGVTAETLTELAHRCKSGTPEWFMPYRVAEAQADTLRSWSPLQVPGLLQCESYARATFAVEPYTPERVAELLAARMERQQVLGRAYLTTVFDAHALQRCIGSSVVMAEQCAYLAAMAERPDISVHVVAEGKNVGLWGGFDIASRDGVTTVCLTTLHDVTSAAADLVRDAVQAYERILGAALPSAESLDFVRTMEEQWKTQI
jgi:transcriptional regulator with XRE-family HTH domain